MCPPPFKISKSAVLLCPLSSSVLIIYNQHLYFNCFNLSTCKCFIQTVLFYKMLLGLQFILGYFRSLEDDYRTGVKTVLCRNFIKSLSVFLSHCLFYWGLQWRQGLNVYCHLSWTWLHRLDWHSTQNISTSVFWVLWLKPQYINTPSLSIILFLSVYVIFHTIFSHIWCTVDLFFFFSPC